MSTRHKPQHIRDLHVSPPARTGGDSLAQETARRHWICPGCGTTHAVVVPEECQSCGASGLEFAYTSPGSQEPPREQHCPPCQ
ncbi:MAG TPA: hypothetical protein VGF67_29805 [Ktedonobacteraceae bacterium]